MPIRQVKTRIRQLTLVSHRADLDLKISRSGNFFLLTIKDDGQIITLYPWCHVCFQFNYQEFMESWQQSVPDGMTTSLGQLRVSSCFIAVDNSIIRIMDEEFCVTEVIHKFYTRL